MVPCPEGYYSKSGGITKYSYRPGGILLHTVLLGTPLALLRRVERVPDTRLKPDCTDHTARSPQPVLASTPARDRPPDWQAHDTGTPPSLHPGPHRTHTSGAIFEDYTASRCNGVPARLPTRPPVLVRAPTQGSPSAPSRLT